MAITVVPEVLVTGGGGSLDGLAATLMRSLTSAEPNVGGPEAVPLVNVTDLAPAAVVVADVTQAAVVVTVDTPDAPGEPEVPAER